MKKNVPDTLGVQELEKKKSCCENPECTKNEELTRKRCQKQDGEDC